MTEQPTKQRGPWTREAIELFALLGDKPVAYHPLLTVAFDGDPAPGLVLVQALWFDGEARDRGRAWWDKTDAQWCERLGFHIKRFRRCMDLLTWDGLALLNKRPSARVGDVPLYHVDYVRTKAYLLSKLAARLRPQQSLELPVEIPEESAPALAPNTPTPRLDRTGDAPLDETGNERWTKQATGQPIEEKEEEKESVCGSPRENTHPAILAFWEATGRKFWPQSGLIKFIIEQVGNDPARVELWKQINIARLRRGEILMNIDKSLAWLAKGQIPPPVEVVTASRSAGRTSRRGGLLRREQVEEATPEERAAATERAKHLLDELEARAGGRKAQLVQRRQHYVDQMERLGVTTEQRQYFAQAIARVDEMLAKFMESTETTGTEEDSTHGTA